MINWSEISLFFFLLPEILLLYVFVVVILIFVFNENKTKILIIYYVKSSIFIVILSLILCLFYLFEFNNISYLLFNSNYCLNKFFNLIRIIVLVLFLIFLIHLNDLSNNKNLSFYNYEIILLIPLLILSIFFILGSVDLLFLFLSIEMFSYILYILISFKKNSEYAIEAGLKYYVIGSYTSCFFILGICLLYGYTGLINLNDIFYFFLINCNNIDYLVVFSLIAIFSSLIFKIGSFPFHMWVCDVYEGSDNWILLILSTVSKFPIYILINKLIFLYLLNLDMYIYIYIYIFICSILSVVFGSILALNQTKIERILGYSSIVNVGILLPIYLVNNIYSLFGLVFYLVTYFVSLISLLLLVNSIFIFKKNYKNNLFQYVSFLKKDFLVGIILIFSFLSLLGLPPFIGFFGKLYLFTLYTLNKFYLFVLILIVTTVISIIYYLLLICNYYFYTFNYNIRFFYFNIKENTAYIIYLMIVFNFLYLFFFKYLFFLILNNYIV